jgi:hypothetical protein
MVAGTLSPCAMARGGPAGGPKATGLSDSGRARKRMLNGFAVRRGAACLTLLGQYSARSWEWATMAAFGESCRDSGHGFSSVFDPTPTCGPKR